MILSFAAVREDRMPGGRNSGAVYNMYKVKYKKHKKANKPGGNGGTPNSGTPGPSASNSASSSPATTPLPMHHPQLTIPNTGKSRTSN